MTQQKKLKIVYIIPTRTMGGGEHQVLEISKNLKALGHKILVVCNPANTDFIDSLNDHNIEMSILTSDVSGGLFLTKIGIFFDLLKSYKKLLREYTPDIVIANTFISALTASFYGKKAAKVIYSVMVIRDLRYLKYAFKFIFSRMSGLIFNSAFTKDSYSKSIPINDLNLINYSLVKHPKAAQANDNNLAVLRQSIVKDKHKLIGYIGRVSAEKRVMDFMRVAELMKGDNTLRFVLIGGYDENDNYYRDVVNFAENALPNRVTFLGYRNDALSLLSIMDAIVLPTYGEGFGRVALEAAYLGVPIIATKPGGTEEVLESVPRAKLVHSGDPKALKGALIELMEQYPKKPNTFHKPEKETDQMLLGKFGTKALVENELAFYYKVINQDKLNI